METLTSSLPRWKTISLFAVILALGVFARLWEFGSMPPGLNPDEASIAVEAYSLYKFGVDRYGLSYPVHLISWGSGQNALYAYLLIPSLVLNGGINAFAVRLPMVIAGILSLPLIYLAGRILFNERFALLAMFLMAVSPWHIVNSRWAVESNIMPFLFLAGFTALTLADKKNWWFPASACIFAISLYSYGTTYAAVPVFLLLTVPVLVKTDRSTWKQVFIGGFLFLLISFPIWLFMAVNTLQLSTIQLGAMTIPRLPVEARYETMAAVFGERPLQALAANAKIMFTVLWTQSDAYPWNFVEPFGYFYKVTFPLVLAGFLLTLPFNFLKEKKIESWLLAAWGIAALVVGVVHPVNLTRFNIAFTPVLFFIAVFLLWLEKRIPVALMVSTAALLVGFVLFNQAYHGEEYRKRTSTLFNEGIIPAIDYAVGQSTSLICFTEQRYSLYIYVLLTQRYHPSEYVNDLEWLAPEDLSDPARTPRALNQFRFRLADCAGVPEAVYILVQGEVPPVAGINYKDKQFGKFKVHVPK